MTLLIDPPNSAGHGRLWSHLSSDSSFEEVHRFAQALGIPRRAFDRDHYDIPAERYDEVLAAGAAAVSSRELISRLTGAGLRRRKAQVLRPRAPGRSLVRPPRLREGDRVAVVAPAGPVGAEALARGVDVLRSWGLQVDVGRHAVGRHEHLDYLSAADEDRAADLAHAWCDPEVRGVLCARGGYGAQRIVDLLDWPALAEAGPKVLLGFSDVTALHQAFAARLGLATVHGPGVITFGELPEGDESREHLRRMLLDPEATTSLTPEPIGPEHRLVPGSTEGVLVGGNLALLAAGAGTAHQQPAAGSVAMLEDIGEAAYRLDRLLTQLLRSGWFDGVRGVALGGTGSVTPQTMREIALDRLGPLGVPMLSGLPFGHQRRNLSFPLGVVARLNADRGTLVLREPALA